MFLANEELFFVLVLFKGPHRPIIVVEVIHVSIRYRLQHNRQLYTAFVNLTKAFDTVSREGLWRIMGKFGWPGKFITMVRQFHDGMNAKVLDNGEFSDAFPVSNGVIIIEPRL